MSRNWLFLCGCLPLVCACDLGKLFDRADPVVEQARAAIDASYGDTDANLPGVRRDLEDLLHFRCDADAGLDRVNELANGSVDLGLLVFRLAEQIGHRFGDEDVDAGPDGEAMAAERAKQLDCIKALLTRLVAEPRTPQSLVLKSFYLLGNFAFLAKKYQEAIDHYDRALTLHAASGTPAIDSGAPATDDDVARAAAWNRAIALQRLEDQKDAGDDAKKDAQQDSPSDAQPPSDSSSPPDSQPDGADSNDSPSPSQPDSGHDSPDSSDPNDTNNAQPDSAQPPDASPPPPKPDPRELDRFDQKSPYDPQQQAHSHPRSIPKALDK